MNWLDIVILVIVAGGAFSGLRRGLIKSVLSLAGIIIGVVLAGQLYTQVAGMLTFISQEKIADAVAFIIILGVVMIIASVIASMLKWVVSLVMLGWVNRLGGAVFGGLLAAISIGAVLTIWIRFLGTPSFITESGLAGIILSRFPAVLALLPHQFDPVRSFFQ